MIQKFKTLKYGLIPACILLGLLVVGCDQYEKPDAIWNPDVSFDGLPTINSVEPANLAAAGINEIKLYGENFSTVKDSNLVYMNGNPVLVKDATDERITLYRPNVVSDTARIKLVVPSALGVAEFFPYGIESVRTDMGDGDLDGNAKIYTMAVDKNEVLYLAGRKKLLKIETAGEVIEVGRTDFSKLTDMRFGPDGFLWVTEGKKEIFRIDPATGGEERIAKVDESITFFDIDAQGILYGAKDDGLVVIMPDASSRIFEQFLDYKALCIRVFGDKLYYLAEYKGDDDSVAKLALWFTSINAQGEVGAPQLALDWSRTGDYADIEVTDLTFSEDGMMYLALSDITVSPLVVSAPNGDGTYSAALSPLYTDQSLLNPIADEIVWGNGVDLYLNRGITVSDGNIEDETSKYYQWGRVMKLGMAKQGAAYHGRK